MFSEAIEITSCVSEFKFSTSVRILLLEKEFFLVIYMTSSYFLSYNNFYSSWYQLSADHSGRTA
jgi:hypothetical protein